MSSADSDPKDVNAIKYLHEIFAIQSKAFLADQSPSVETRIGYLHKLAGMLMSNRQEIRDALQSDFGNHPYGATDLIETLGVAGRAMFVASKLPEWLKEEERYCDPAIFGNARAYLTREPKGVIGTLSPFNFPIDLSAGPLVEQLAGGNRVIIKPSELTPATSLLLKKMINATFPVDLVEVVVGGVDLGIEFSKLKWNHLLYTGSPAVGKLVMAECAKNLTACTLELGGKCPAIIAPGQVNEKNVESIIGTKLLKNGQMCVSIDYTLLLSSEIPKFIELSKAYIAKLNGYSKSADCTGIIADRHLQRLVRLIDEARKASPESVIDTEPGVEADLITRRMPLTLVVDPSKDLAISKEEVFGPILSIIPYDNLEGAVAHVNSDERPLALYFYSENEKEIEYVLKNTKAGGTTINSAALHAALPDLGFGGVGNSGMGRHHGQDGIREFTNPRGIVRRGDAPDLANAFAPPYAFGQAVADHAFAEAAKAASA